MRLGSLERGPIEGQTEEDRDRHEQRQEDTRKWLFSDTPILWLDLTALLFLFGIGVI